MSRHGAADFEEGRKGIDEWCPWVFQRFLVLGCPSQCERRMSWNEYPSCSPLYRCVVSRRTRKDNSNKPKESEINFFISRRRWIIFFVLFFFVILLSISFSPIRVSSSKILHFFSRGYSSVRSREREWKEEERMKKTIKKSWNGVITYDQCDYNHTNFYGVEGTVRRLGRSREEASGSWLALMVTQFTLRWGLLGGSKMSSW